MQVKSIAECSPSEHSAILSTFIKLPFVIKIFVLSIIEWPFYTGFTVHTLTCRLICATKIGGKIGRQHIDVSRSQKGKCVSSQYEASKKIPKYIKNTHLLRNIRIQSYNLQAYLTHFPSETRNMLSSIGHCANPDHLASEKLFNQELQLFHVALMYP